MFIYKITNKKNGKIYIGKTERTVEERWKEHLSRALNNDTRYLYLTMRKHGIDNFSIECIDEAKDSIDLNEKEIYYINFFDSFNSGYNMTIGGESNPMNSDKVRSKHRNLMRSDDIKKKISDSMKEYKKINPVSDETRKKLSEYRKKMIFIHKGSKCIQVPKLDLEKYLNEGWVKGGKKCDPEVVARRSKNRQRKVFCIDMLDNNQYHFNSVKEAGLWYQKKLTKPNKVSTCMEKIKKSFTKNLEIDNLRWFYEECVETIERVSES